MGALTARPNVLLLVGCAGVGASMLLFRDIVAGFYPTILAFPILAFAMALIVMAASERRGLIGQQAVPGAGLLASGAYSIYLSHKAVLGVVKTSLSHAPAIVQDARLPIALVATMAIGAMLYISVERPFLKLRDRFDGSTRSTPAKPTTAPTGAR